MRPDEPCPIPRERSLAALRLECRALDPVVDALAPGDLTRPTRLPAWDVRGLLAHLIRAPGRLLAYLTGPVPPRAEVDWLGYWRAARDHDPEGIAQRAVELAGELPGPELLRRWRRVWPEAAVEAEHAPADRLLVGPFGAMQLDHYLPTRVVELTVHGLDLRHALDLEEVATPLGLEVTCAVLDGLLEVPRPVDLARDDVAWVLAATGRAVHDDPDLPVLR